jgi:hypothetical protein
MLTIQAPELQIRLLESAIQLLIWESSYWATKSALEQWKKGLVSEEETPSPARFSFNPEGWKKRAIYIGGGDSADWTSEPNSSNQWPGLARMEQTPGQPLLQIRRLVKAEHPLGDVWLSAAQEAQASVSHTHIQFTDEKTGQIQEVQMSRFQNLMQPVLVKGHPALNTPSLDYLRQRTWKQLEAFHSLKLEEYPRGWFL